MRFFAGLVLMAVTVGSTFAPGLGAGIWFGAGMATAQESTPPPEGTPRERGRVTNRPIPRFVSLKASEGNVRRGPSLRHRIDWVFKRRNMPLEVVGEFGHWRQVRDRDGVGGWVHYSLLSGARHAIIETDLTPLYARANEDAQISAYLEAGVVARIDRCGPLWCRLQAGGHRGWTTKPNLWGVRPDEVIE